MTGQLQALKRLFGIQGGKGDWIFRAATGLAALLIIGMLLMMLAILAEAAWPAITRFGFGFLTSSRWDAVRSIFGALPAIYGTLLTSAIGMLIALPVSVGAAVFLAELCPGWARAPASLLIESLASLPSVVLGLWGLFVLVPAIRSPVESWLGSHASFIPLFRGPPLGIGYLAAGLLLSIMVLPYITAITRDAIRGVPAAQREAMLALGATRWEMIWKAVIPYARSGIVAGSILGLGRALGETMAVTMVIGNGNKLTSSLFAPGTTMASKIATEFNEATDDVFVGALVELALILFVVTLIVNIGGRLLVRFSLARTAAGARW